MIFVQDDELNAGHRFWRMAVLLIEFQVQQYGAHMIHIKKQENCSRLDL